MRRTLSVVIAIIAVSAAGLLIYRSCRPKPDDHPPPLVKLTPEQMRQLPDPRQPMPPAGNALWCASTHAAWKQLPALLNVAAPLLTTQPELSVWLNAAADPADYVPAKALFSLAGPANADTLARIRDGVQRQFGEPVMMPLTSGGPEDLIAFARLQVAAKFPVPYANRQGGMRFTDGAGKATTARAFGNVPGEGEELLPGLSRQARVLFADPAPVEQSSAAKDEFAINLSGNEADLQVIAACLPRPSSLHTAWEHVEARTAKYAAEVAAAKDGTREEAWRAANAFSVAGKLAVPLLGFEAGSELPDLKGTFESPPGWRLVNAAQMVQFSLDRTGAKLKAETVVITSMASIPDDRDYIFDRPFLVAMRQRESKAPFFLLWVDDAAMMSAPVPE